MRLSMPYLTLCLTALCTASALAQPGIMSKELLIQYTPD